MEFEQMEQSVNNVEVAEPQQNDVNVNETVPQGNESGKNLEVAEPKPVQDADTNAYYAEQRRKQELEQYRQMAQTYEQRIQEIAEITGYQSPDELFQAMEMAKRQQEEQRYREAGIDPNVLNQFLETHPDVQFARQMKMQQEQEARFRQEANELFQEFPDLDPKDIPQEVWQLKEQRGLSLLDAYLRVSYKNLGQQKEQEAIQKLQGNAQASTGSLSGGDVEHNMSVSKMPKQDFEALLRKVKAGEVRSL